MAGNKVTPRLIAPWYSPAMASTVPWRLCQRVTSGVAPSASSSHA